MFCYQCEQTPKGGCTKIGVCGKNENIASLQDTIIFGLKGVAAYAFHARELGYTDPEVNSIMEEALFSTLTNANFNLQETVGMALKVGSATVKVMDLLDKAHVENLGIPTPVTVTSDKVEGKCILVTGHDLLALKELLKQTEGKNINIYTHSEMLPAHGYPELKKYSHLKGNVGKAWYDQRQVFEAFPGAILATTNCVMPIRKDATYAERMFSFGITGLEDVQKIEGLDFTPVIEKALTLPSASGDGLWKKIVGKLNGSTEEVKTFTTGFHHLNVLPLAPQIIEAVKAGKIRRFFVIAGCDSPTKGRDYFRELALAIPKDCIIITTSCGKFRFNDIDFGVIEGTGIPRFLDLGQCNNSGSAVKIALALAEAFNCSVNDLPLSIVLSWFEQKAVAILLGLFSLGVKNMYVGPKAPEFLAPGVVEVLQNTFNLQLISGNAEEDLTKMLG
ncbi:hydroxylamine reductase [Desulforamulus aquiferis]|uniref:Hydroxylamine reductase n=1 Tax=Desulforamulus aquiferis TaxID=1397668 RepID=A0AAW7ZIW0_9FIRM|nr:hydroxylamine reductase [Desulforamulus aquiferis]MDO7789108.1 hydroxylamine reductase [Desulforamulus aquiferis]RYD02866.1 hydroxylamine reductase [Desulforamulus aquiferis]